MWTALGVLGELSLSDYKDVIITCPMCFQSEVVSDLEQLDSLIHQQWEMSLKFARHETEKDEIRKGMVTAGLMNQKDRIIEILKRNGFLKICCRTCLTNKTQELYAKAGMKFIRRGNLLLEESFYNKEKNFIESEIKKHQLDKVTFFT